MLDLMKAVKGLTPIAEAINRVLDHTSTDQLKALYYGEGIKTKIEIEDAVIYVLVKSTQPQDPEDPEA